MGIVCNPEIDEVICFINKSSSKAFLDHLVVGSRTSLFAAVITHESYNLKGKVTELRDVSADEMAVCDNLREGMYTLYNELGIPEDLAARYWNRTPDIAIVISVDTIFSQTPGPNAGKQL